MRSRTIFPSGTWSNCWSNWMTLLLASLCASLPAYPQAPPAPAVPARKHPRPSYALGPAVFAATDTTHRGAPTPKVLLATGGCHSGDDGEARRDPREHADTNRGCVHGCLADSPTKAR